ncbi:MAG: hypothetical protein JJU15_01085 [Pararhodobacter sp.]|nr:hypothetical protein [Pararhodobacter sp.]
MDITWALPASAMTLLFLQSIIGKWQMTVRPDHPANQNLTRASGLLGRGAVDPLERT